MAGLNYYFIEYNICYLTEFVLHEYMLPYKYRLRYDQIFIAYSPGPYWKAVTTVVENPETGCCEYILIDDYNMSIDFEAVRNWSVQMSEPAGNCSSCVFPENENPFTFLANTNGTRMNVHVRGEIAGECNSNTCAAPVVFSDLSRNIIVNESSCVARNIGNSSLWFPTYLLDQFLHSISVC